MFGVRFIQGHSVPKTQLWQCAFGQCHLESENVETKLLILVPSDHNTHFSLAFKLALLPTFYTVFGICV